MLYILIILLSYFLFLLVLIVGWSMASRPIKSRSGSFANKLSVIVAMRNEENTVESLLQSLAAQTYAGAEFILVDDHSADDTLWAIEQFCASNPGFAPLILQNAGTGKKAAITTGVIHATGDIIVTTDADSMQDKDWLVHIERAFTSPDVKMVAGAVRIGQNGTLLADMQAIEFASLIGSAGATLTLGFPTMCNGANLAYRKSAFGEVGGYQDTMHVTSGDDEALMQKIETQFPRSIRFMSEPLSVVVTRPSVSASVFLQQRLRWAGKWRYSASPATKVTALYIIVVQLALIAAFIRLVSADSVFIISLLAGRALLEGIFLWRVCSFSGVKWSWISFALLQVVYPFYALSVGVASNFSGYSWKKRRYRQSVS